LIAYRLPGVAAGVVWKYDVGHIAEESSESKADEVAGEPINSEKHRAAKMSVLKLP